MQIKPLVILPEIVFTNPEISFWRKLYFLMCGKENHEIYGNHITCSNIAPYGMRTLHPILISCALCVQVSKHLLLKHLYLSPGTHTLACMHSCKYYFIGISGAYTFASVWSCNLVSSLACFRISSQLLPFPSPGAREEVLSGSRKQWEEHSAVLEKS